MFKVQNNFSIKKHFNKAQGFENAAWREVRHSHSNYDAVGAKLAKQEGKAGPLHKAACVAFANDIKAQLGNNSRAIAAVDAWLADKA